MREILFRGKRADNNEWVYGSLILNGEHDYAIYDCNTHNTLNGVEVIEETIGQFTGLAKDNTRIYEGDLISLANFIYEVRFEDGKFVGYHVTNREWGRWGDLKRLFDIDFKNYEWNVIGNIHENPELLSQPATT